MSAMNRPIDIEWTSVTWEGNRRAHLRIWRRLSVRERLEAVEAMAEVAARLACAGRKRYSLSKTAKQETEGQRPPD